MSASAPGGPVRVKICGVKSVDDALVAVRAGADMVGLNFHPGSKRFVEPERAAAIAEAVPRDVWCVGVFVDLERREIEDVRGRVRLDAIQLHGGEPAEMLQGWTVPVIRAVRLRSAEDAARAARGIDPDFYLCEGASDRGHGGVGASFDWAWAGAFPADRLFLAGGLDPGNVADAVRSVRPFAVDVASGVEASPGRKEPALVAEFVRNAKAA